MLNIQEIDPAELRVWEENPRTNDHAVDAVAKSVENFGFNVPILCDQNKNIIAGHTRWKAARQLGLNAVPVIQLEMTENQRKAFAVADNKTAEIADWDMPKLRDVFAELQKEDFDLQDLGFSDADLRRILLENGRDEDNILAVSCEPRTKADDLWVLGRHRLLCGDASKSEDLQFLIGDIQIDHIFGGPPYFNLREYIQWESFQDYMFDMRGILKCCYNKINEGGVIVWNICSLSSQHLDLTSHHSLAMQEVGFRYIDTIIWMKSGANFSVLRNAHIARNRIYYPTFQWEALLVFQKPGPMPKMTRDGMRYMSNFQSNVWEIASVQNRQEIFGHPDVCPVELPYRSIQAYTSGDAVIFEPFGGSGTTLIAAEKAGRRAFVMERMPSYCDIIIHRWEILSGQKAIRIENDFSSNETDDNAPISKL